MSDKFGFFKNAGLYFIGNSLPKVIAFFLLPIYSKYISPQDFGYFDLSQSYIYLVIPILSLEIYLAIMRFTRESNDKSDIAKFIATGFSSLVIFSFIVVLGIIILALNPQIKYGMHILSLLVVLMLQRYYTSVCRGLGKNRLFVLTGLISSIIVLSVNYFLIVFLNMKGESLFYSAILGFLYQSIHIELKLTIRKHIRIQNFDKNLLKSLINFSLPLSVGSILYFFLNSYTRFFIERNIGLEANGFFAIASKFTLFISFLTSAFTMAWQDYSFLPQDTEQKIKRFESGINLYFKFLLLSGNVLVFIVAILFPFIIDEQYESSYSIIALSIGVTLLASSGDFLTQTFLALKGTKIILYTSLIITILSIILIPLLIDPFGINGVNIALMISYLMNIILRSLYLRRVYGLQINYLSHLLFFVIFILICYVYQMNDKAYNIIGLIISTVIWLIVFKSEITQLLIKFKIIRKRAIN